MGTTYNAKLDVSCIKQHTCLGCSAEYHYRLERNVTGSGGTEAAAAANAEAAAVKALENDVDQHPCPHCGMMQPDMIAEVRKGRFVAGMWIAPIFILVAFFLALPHVLTISTSAMIASAGVALAGLIMVSGVFVNPNKDMASGQMASSEKVQSGEVGMTKEGSTSTSVDDFSAPEGGHWTGVILIGAALLAALAPLVLPVISGWSVNDTYPAVVGPGDETTIYFDQKITSLKSYWRGSVGVTVTNPDEVGGQHAFSAKTKSSSWGNTISGKSVSNETKAMYAEVTVPSSDELAGKAVDLQLNANVSYPIAMGNMFDDRSGTFSHTQTLKLSSAGSGTTYWQSWIFGQLAALLLVLVGGFFLIATANKLVATANPPNLLVADDDGDDVGGDYDGEE